MVAVRRQVSSEVRRRIPAGFPESVVDAVVSGLEASAKRLKAMPRT